MPHPPHPLNRTWYPNYWKMVKRSQTPVDRFQLQRKVARTLKLSRGARHRLEWFIYYDTTATRNAARTCRHFGISRQVFYTWKRRFDPNNLRSLEDRDRTPIQKRQRRITPQQEERLLALRRGHIRWGKMKLAVLYEQRHGEKISSWQVQKVIEKYRLYYNPKKAELLRKKRLRAEGKKRITELKRKPFPGFLVALDTVVIYWGGVKRYILTAIDTTSKIAFARMYTTKSSRSAADFLQRLFWLLDGSMLNALHDNGSEFYREFQSACRELGITQYWTRPKTPNDNAVNERFNRTMKEEFLALGNYTPDPELFNRKLTEWLIEYSFVRPHQSLGYQTPWESYNAKAKVSRMYSSITGA